MRRGATVAISAALLAAADLATKGALSSPAWGQHQRTHAWVGLSVALLVVAGVLAALRTRTAAASASFLAGGVLGNLVSALLNGLRVPNPFVAGDMAFALADVFIIVGLAGLVGSLTTLAVRHRHRLLPPRRWERALLRRLSG